jgi:hypothetical protein
MNPACLGLCAILLTGAPTCWSAEWLRVDAAERHARIAIDLHSLQTTAAGPEVRMRISRDQPLRHAQGFLYRSYVAVVRFDCRRAELIPVAVTYFERAMGAGPAGASETDLSSAGIAPSVLAEVAPATRQVLLKAACGEGASAGAGSVRTPSC